jgi:LmbE family N-acetylglucosaminyl deacetylase
MKRIALSSFAIFIAYTLVSAQMRVVPLDDEKGHVALGFALRHLKNTGILLHTTAHPDDENNGLLVMLNRGQGFRTALATATRGNGGQNEIGPELFEALGVLRTEELAALHRFDGAEQYFTRAVDFGYSFSIDETFEKWGRDEITSDFVRLIRMIRPDVVISLMPGGAGGGQHHQASAVLTHDAVKVSGDPAKYADQIQGGLRAWQPKKFYYTAGFFGFGDTDQDANTTRINLAVYDRLLGKTYFEIGIEARSMHKCQGMAQLLALPGPATTSYRLTESTIPGAAARQEQGLFDGIDTTISGLAQFAGSKPPTELTDGLAAIAASVARAQEKFDADADEAAVPSLVDGLRAVRLLRSRLAGMALDEGARYEIDFRLRQKESEFEHAILLASAVDTEVLADDGVVVPGQPVKVSVIVANRGAGDISVRQIKFRGFDADAPCTLTAFSGGGFFGGGRAGRGRDAAPSGPPLTTLNKDAVAHCDPTLKIPATARVTEPYWRRRGEEGRYRFDADAPFGLPYRPNPFDAQLTIAVAGGEEIVERLPVQYRYEGNIFSGEKRMDLLVAPALSVRVSPEIAIVPAGAIAAGGASASREKTAARKSTREVRVTVVNDTRSAADTTLKLDLPPGWTASPPEQTVALAREDESQTVRFEVRPGANTAAGEFHVHAVASYAGQRFDRGYQVIEYPHSRRQHIYHAADTLLKVIDVRTAPNLVVGYVMGVGDEVPPAIEQLGAKLELLGPDDLAWGNLSRFDAIVTGVRAYERRADLRANNNRLLEYVRNGGTLIVQYNKFEFNEAQYGPYPAKVSQNRVTDENSPVTVLAPNDPAMTFPNRIGESAWKGWVQERGLYFLGDRDPRYRDLVQLEDPFPYNKGPKTGALVEAVYGKGHWVYVGLGLWRQLPAGVDGAYQILANLISLGKASASRPATTAALAK